MSTHMNHIVICNYEPSARMLLDTLEQEYDLEETSIVIFSNMERPADIPSEFEWQCGDPTKESSLSKVRMGYAKACIIVGARTVLPQVADATTLLTIFTIRSFIAKHEAYKQRKHDLYIAAEILDSENIVHAKTAGANEVIESKKIGFSLLSHAVSQQGSASILSSIANYNDQSIFIHPLPSTQSYPHLFHELVHDWMINHQILVIGYQKDGQHYINPPKDCTVDPDMLLIYLAKEPKI